jgi:hypothetical protein
MFANSQQKTHEARTGWSLVALFCPVGAFFSSFVVGVVTDADFGLDVIGVLAYAALTLSLFASATAFVRRERLKWLALLGPIIMVWCLFSGVSV